ncbi:hypothetical protein FQ192_02790 [Pseudomonas sp. ANT_J12]|nr:hypothetical protein FQ192_02790 [Pseudomonas sp. ANT_J12]
MIVPTLCVGMPHGRSASTCDAERHGIHSHAERGNDHVPIDFRGRKKGQPKLPKMPCVLIALERTTVCAYANPSR